MFLTQKRKLVRFSAPISNLELNYPPNSLKTNEGDKQTKTVLENKVGNF